MPLHEAMVSHNSPEIKDIIELLLDYGAYINAVDAQGNTPLHLLIDNSGELVRSQDVQIYPTIEMMLDRGADIIRKGKLRCIERFGSIFPLIKQLRRNWCPRLSN